MVLKLFKKGPDIPKNPSTRDDGGKELREWPRYKCFNSAAASMVLVNGKRGQVADLSFGGVAVLFETKAPPPKECCAKLKILGLEEECQVTYCYSHDGVCGFRFIERSKDFDRFLAFLCLNMNRGATLAAAPDSKPERRHYIGEGQTDLLVMNGQNKLDLKNLQVELNYPTDKAKCRIILKQGKFEFSTDSNDPSINLDRALVQQGLAIALGIEDRDIDVFSRKLVNDGLKWLSS